MYVKLIVVRILSTPLLSQYVYFELSRYADGFHNVQRCMGKVRRDEDNIVTVLGAKVSIRGLCPIRILKPFQRWHVARVRTFRGPNEPAFFPVQQRVPSAIVKVGGRPRRGASHKMLPVRRGRFETARV